MHIVNLIKPISYGDVQTGTGLYYIWDGLAGLALTDGYSKEVQPCDVPVGPLDEDESPARIIIVSPNGFGDVLFLTPSLVKLATMFPQAELCVSLISSFTDALRGLPEVQILPYPLPRSETLKRGTRMINLEHVLTEERDLHAVAAIARRIGVTLTKEDDKRCVYKVDRSDFIAAGVKYPRSEKPRVGVQLMASTMVRTYPAKLMMEVLGNLLEKGWEIFVFGAKDEINNFPKHRDVHNLTKEDPAPSFYESAAILKTCDVVLSPDSALAHLGGALGLPTVALYGPYHWGIRTAYHPTVKAIQGHASCSPCYAGNSWPEHGECAGTGRCEALAEIPPGRVVREVEKAFENSESEARS